MTLDVELQPHDKVVDLTPPWEHYCTKDVNPSILFSSHQEHQDTLALGGRSHMAVLSCFYLHLVPVLHWPFVLQDRLLWISLQTTLGILGKVASFPLCVGKVLLNISFSHIIKRD